MEEKTKDVSDSHRPWQSCWISNSPEKQQHFLTTLRGTFLANMLTSHAVLEKLIMSRPIRGHDSNLGFLMASKRYNTSGHLAEQFGKFIDWACSGYVLVEIL